MHSVIVRCERDDSNFYIFRTIRTTRCVLISRGNKMSQHRVLVAGLFPYRGGGVETYRHVTLFSSDSEVLGKAWLRLSGLGPIGSFLLPISNHQATVRTMVTANDAAGEYDSDDVGGLFSKDITWPY